MTSSDHCASTTRDPDGDLLQSSSRKPYGPGEITLVLIETYPGQSSQASLFTEVLQGFSVHTLAHPGQNDEAMPARVGDWVDHFQQLLEELDPDGDVAVGGWSFGGVIAYELAKRLRATGMTVPVVLMLDSSRPRLRPNKLRAAVRYHIQEAALLCDDDRAVAYLKKSARNFVSVSLWRIRRRSRGRLRRLGWDLQRRSGAGTGVPGDSAGTDLALPSGHLVPSEPLVRSIHKSYLNYRPAPTGIPVLQVVTEDSIRRSQGDPTLGWSAFMRGGSASRILSCTHREMWADGTREEVASIAAGLLLDTNWGTDLRR